MKSRSPAILFAIGVVGTIVLAVGVIWALLRTGDARAVSDNAPLIAAVIALGGVGTAQMVSIALEDQRTKEARDLEDRRTKEARDLEDRRAHEAALQNYFEQVGMLLIEQPLRRASPGDNLSTVVRAQTLSVLEGLDPDRKRILLLFLYESGLIYKDKPVVTLEAANLSDANLMGADLSDANLMGADLSDADLSDVDLSDANLMGVNLSDVDLSDANLIGAHLTGAYLIDADLSDANLGGANLSDVDLSDANLDGANLMGAYLRDAILIRANLSNAILINTNLTNADLSHADLSHADLSRADLSGAFNITNEKLEQQAASLEGATMPNWQKYKDWLKSKGRGKDREKSGTS